MSRSDEDALSETAMSRGSDHRSPKCLTDVNILLRALESGDLSEGRGASHLRECERCRSHVTAMRRVLGELAAGSGDESAAHSACLDDIELANILDGEGGGRRPHRERIAHLASCADCREALASLVELVADDSIRHELELLARPIRKPSRNSPRRVVKMVGWTAGVLATAAALLLFVTPLRERGDTRHRAPTISAVEAPLATEPFGDAANPRKFRWTPVMGADRYRVTLFDATGRVLFVGERDDTVLSLPDSVVLKPATSFLWKVEARTAVDRWTSSDLIEFHVRAPNAPRSDSP